MFKDGDLVISRSGAIWRVLCAYPNGLFEGEELRTNSKRLITRPENYVLVQNHINLSVTASRKGLSAAQIHTARHVLTRLKPAAFIHGDCIGGDARLHTLAWAMCQDSELSRDMVIYVYPCNVKGKRAFMPNAIVLTDPMPPLERNQLIVSNCDLLLAFPYGEEILRSGTWATVRYARKRQRLILIVPPDGSLWVDNIRQITL